jgi:hypothetical protein
MAPPILVAMRRFQPTTNPQYRGLVTTCAYFVSPCLGRGRGLSSIETIREMQCDP